MTHDFDLRGQVLPTRAMQPREATSQLQELPEYQIARILTFAAFSQNIVSAIDTERGGMATSTFDVLDRRLHVQLTTPRSFCGLPKRPERVFYMLGLAVAALKGLEAGFDSTAQELRTARALAVLPCSDGDWDEVTVTEETPYSPAKMLAFTRGGANGVGSSVIRQIDGAEALPPTLALDVYQTPAIDGQSTTVVHLTVRTTRIKPPEIGPMARLRLHRLWEGRTQ